MSVCEYSKLSTVEGRTLAQYAIQEFVGLENGVSYWQVIVGSIFVRS